MAMNQYIVAVRRERRADAPADWLQQLGDLEGVSVVGSSSKQAQVLADSSGIERVQHSLGSYTHIEPVISHKTQ